MVTREARCGEQGCACTREGGRYQVRCKSTKKKGGAPVEAEGTVILVVLGPIGTSRILEGLAARRGLVERREGSGCRDGREAGHIGGRQRKKAPGWQPLGFSRCGTR